MLVEGAVRRAENEHDHAVWSIWHTELLQRLEVLPKLKDFMPERGKPALEEKPVPQIDENAIKGRLKAYQERLKQQNVG